MTINAARGARARGRDRVAGAGQGRPTSSIWRVPTIEQIPYWPGADLVRTVIKRGRVVLDRS